MTTRPLIKESLLVLNVIGLDPYKRNAFSQFRLVSSLFLLPVSCLNFLLDLIINWKGLKSMEAIAIFSAFFQILTKLCILIMNREKLVEVINKMEEFWLTNKYGKELQNEIEKIYLFVTKIMKGLLGFIIIAAISFLGTSFVGTSKKLPFPTYYPTDLNKSPDYEIVFGFDIGITIVAAFFEIGFDFLFVSLIVNITNELKIIKMGIKKIPINLKIKGDTEESLKEVYEIIEHHNLILGCMKLTREIYYFLLLNIYFVNMIEMSFSMLSLISNGFPPTLTNLYQSCLIAVFYMLELLFYCSVGQYLITESLSVSDTVYEIDWWIKTQPKLRKALVLMIQRSNKVENLTAGGMFALNLSGFSTVTRSALSFFTLINAVYKDV